MQIGDQVRGEAQAGSRDPYKNLIRELVKNKWKRKHLNMFELAKLQAFYSHIYGVYTSNV